MSNPSNLNKLKQTADWYKRKADTLDNYAYNRVGGYKQVTKDMGKEDTIENHIQEYRRIQAEILDRIAKLEQPKKKVVKNILKQKVNESFPTVKNWNIEQMTGYKPLTTLYTDFGLAEPFKGGVQDTYKRMFNEYKDNYKYLTELVMVLNWKIWEHYETNEPLAQLYNSLWEKADAYAMAHLKGEELSYFFRTTD